jgi:hypothetical protein
MTIHRLLTATAVATVMSLAIAGGAQADFTVSGPFSGNDPFPNTSATFGNSISLAKIECSGPDATLVCTTKEDGASSGDYRPAFTVNVDPGSNGRSGTWSFDPNAVTGLGGNPVLYPKYLAIKGGPNYLVYTFTDGALGGTWNSTTLGAALSHISFYDSQTVVPIPAALPLMLTALAGLGLVARRRSGDNA